jgi:CubicO group peptidase (beta-lactamase class C family)
VVATLPCVLKLVAAGAVGLDDRVGRFFSGAGLFQAPSLADAPVRALLAHASGLPAWRPLYAQPAGRRAALAYVLNAPLEHPAGAVVYSDLGFMLLAGIVERVAHERLDAFAAREVFAPLGMQATGFGPISGVPVAATEDCGWRDRVLEGEVHDENATVWEGVAGHAGLFGTAGDLARYAHAWLTRDERLAPAPLLDDCTLEAARSADGARRGLGWVLAHEGSLGGPGARGYGHTGFTGTSIWIEPDAGVATVLLTNRVHPRRGSPAGVHALRVDVHAAVHDAFGGAA